MSDGSEVRGPDPDEPHVAAFRRGDRSAFEVLVKKHQPFIRTLVRKYVRTDVDAEDVAQLAFIRAFEKRDSFRAESSFRTWLYRIAVNLALNHVRNRPKEVSIEIEDVVGFTRGIETTKLVTAALWRKVEKNLEALPPKQRLVVELRAFHDLSFAEISILAECSEESARASYHVAVKTLRTTVPPPA